MNLFQILFEWKNNCLRKQISNQACNAQASSRATNYDKSRISSQSEQKQLWRLLSNPQRKSAAHEKIQEAAVVYLVMVKHGKEKRNRFSILEVSILILDKRSLSWKFLIIFNFGHVTRGGKKCYLKRCHEIQFLLAFFLKPIKRLRYKK